MFRNLILNSFKHKNISLSDTQVFKRHNVTVPCKKHVVKQIQKQILQENLGVSYQISAAFVRNNQFLQSINNHRLLETFTSLHKMGIQKEDIFTFPTTLKIHRNTIEHNILYLKEAGFTYVSAQVLLRFHSTVKKSISLLKAHSIIPADVNVPEQLFSYLSPKPASFPILKQFTEEDSIADVHKYIIKHYLVWRLQTTIEEVDRVFKTYDRFKYKSFQLMSQMIRLLTDTLKFPHQKILNHSYLLQINPILVKKVMKKFPTLNGIDIKTVMFKYPKLISVPLENFIAIHKYLKDFNITDEAVQKCYEIYTLAPDSVMYRLHELKKIPEFEVLIQNQRIVLLVMGQNKAKLRLQHLQKLNVKCASIHVLCASDSVFERYVQEGNDRTKGFDLVNYLAHELNLEDRPVRQQLMVNPYWYYIPVTTVRNTLMYLLQNNFPKDEISKMCIVLLYPREKVTEALEEIQQNPDTNATKLTTHDRLNLCLYFIEKKHHFSGNGLWQNPVTVNAEQTEEA